MKIRKDMTEEEFIETVANDCIKKMSEEDIQCLRDNPDPLDHHTGYGVYIRNHYIHRAKLPFPAMADKLSNAIITRIMEILNIEN